MVLVLTHIVVNTEPREEFDRQTKAVIDSIRSQPGLIGFSARRELLFDHAHQKAARELDSSVRETLNARVSKRRRPSCVMMPNR